ncbi:MAG TPA: ComF family protein [Synergistaceae bacterium]|nr:ComF family protein [Synergistaceae bacterium]
MNIPDTLFRLLPHLLWPTACPICGAIGVPACLTCLLPLLHPPLPIPLHGASFLLWTGGPYETHLRDLVLEMKYGKNRALAVVMGQALGRIFPKPDADALVPVPLHIDSPRGFNQSEALAQGLKKEWRMPVVDALAWRERCTEQATLEEKERRNMPSDAITIGRKGLAGKQIVLVDDVSTTGTTLCRAQEAVVRGGGRCALAVTWTYTPKRV